MATPYVRCAYTKVKQCDWKEKNLPERTIILSMDIYSKLISLLQKIDTEFLLYFKATEMENRDWEVDDMIIPEQEVTVSTCTALEQVLDVQGVFHSHVNMGVFMSHTDDEHININHNFSIVGNKSGEFAGKTREEVPCGGVTFVKAKLVMVDERTNIELDEIIKEKITKKAHQVQKTTTATQTLVASTLDESTHTVPPQIPQTETGRVNESGWTPDWTQEKIDEAIAQIAREREIIVIEKDIIARERDIANIPDGQLTTEEFLRKYNVVKGTNKPSDHEGA